VFERDLIIGNTTLYEYWSPLARDNEDDSISFYFEDTEAFPYLSIETLKNDSFKMTIEMSDLNYLDAGLYSFRVKLDDHFTQNTVNRKWFEI
jgi:hypothetical protein